MARSRPPVAELELRTQISEEREMQRPEAFSPLRFCYASDGFDNCICRPLGKMLRCASAARHAKPRDRERKVLEMGLFNKDGGRLFASSDSGADALGWGLLHRDAGQRLYGLLGLSGDKGRETTQPRYCAVAVRRDGVPATLYRDGDPFMDRCKGSQSHSPWGGAHGDVSVKSRPATNVVCKSLRAVSPRKVSQRPQLRGGGAGERREGVHRFDERRKINVCQHDITLTACVWVGMP
ncbi:LOW QUALITY PROTEIN: hypothetical protein ColTof3_01921 [Colletotrichum tofieldiae]|nr:LOW QUALITY PROTEIN: hypothetical protein ColTof3_01921 [Colletotrichum tofieldiae]